MARVNIDDKLWSDPRFKALCRLLGSEEMALGRLILVFRMAQEYYSDSEKLIPTEIWDIQGFDYVEKIGFIERHDAGIYVKGSAEHFDWLLKRKAAAKAGGLKSAQSRRERYGSAQPCHDISPEANVEANPKQRFEKPEAKTNPLTLTLTPTLTLNNINTEYIPTKPELTKKPPPLVDGTYLELGSKWLKIAHEEYPWRSQEAKWTGENFGRELEKIAKSLKASPVEMQKLFERFEKDPFWRKNAASPFGLTKRSQNGLRKIDNMIASLRTEFERKQSSQTNLADLRKQFQEDFKTKEELEKILEEEDRNANRY